MGNLPREQGENNRTVQPFSAACQPTLPFETLIQHPLFLFVDNTDLNIVTELTYRNNFTQIFSLRNDSSATFPDINTTLPTHQTPFKPSKRHRISSSDLEKNKKNKKKHQHHISGSTLLHRPRVSSFHYPENIPTNPTSYTANMIYLPLSIYDDVTTKLSL